MNKIKISISILVLIIIASNCKPSMPVKDDYPDALPCYLADRCMTLNVFYESNKLDCSLTLQKCFRYSDWNKCKAETDPRECLDKLAVKL